MKVCKHRLYHAIGARCECMSPYIVLLGFMSWLTGRNQVVTFSASHESGPAVELITKYCTKQGWDMNVEDFQYWFNSLKSMSPNE